MFVITATTAIVGLCMLVGWSEFNVPFQHKYGYIRDEGLCMRQADWQSINNMQNIDAATYSDYNELTNANTDDANDDHDVDC